MKTDNPGWGAPRIHGDLLQLGFAYRSRPFRVIYKALKRRPDHERARRCIAFLHNHREVIAAFEFFTVPMLTFRVLYASL
jgi:hypothetical protein